MSAYDNDYSRVRKTNDGYHVLIGEDQFSVFSLVDGRWLIEPPWNFDMYTRGKFNRPFASADEAIHALIGDPR